MVTTKIIFQAIAGMSVVGGIIGGGVVMMKSDADYFLIVSSSDVATQPEVDLWTVSKKDTSLEKQNQSVSLLTNVAETIQTPVSAPANSTTEIRDQKNYKCQTTNTKKEQDDKNCELYAITFHETNKSADFAGLKETINLKTKVMLKTEVTDKKFFLLKSSAGLFTTWSFDSTKTIKLMSNSKIEAEVAKSYATLTVHGKIVKNQIISETDLVLVKAKTAGNLTPETTNKTYKCSFEKSTTQKAEDAVCSIYSFTTGTLIDKKELKDLDWNTLTIPRTPVSTQLTVAENKYFLIKWNKKSVSDSNNKTVIVVENTTGSETNNPKATFYLESPIIGSFVADSQQVVVLK